MFFFSLEAQLAPEESIHPPRSRRGNATRAATAGRDLSEDFLYGIVAGSARLETKNAPSRLRQSSIAAERSKSSPRIFLSSLLSNRGRPTFGNHCGIQAGVTQSDQSVVLHCPGELSRRNISTQSRLSLLPTHRCPINLRITRTPNHLETTDQLENNTGVKSP